MFGPEIYLQTVCIRSHRIALSKLRLVNHKLAIEVGRHSNVLMAYRICPLCLKNNLVILEDEYHLVTCCPAYAALHLQYSLPVHGDFETFVDIMSNEVSINLQRLAAFVHGAFRLRQKILKQLQS